MKRSDIGDAGEDSTDIGDAGDIGDIDIGNPDEELRMTLMQGEVISEWLDVDEVEEAFAKMRRAAGVRFFHRKLKLDESLLNIYSQNCKKIYIHLDQISQ